MRRFYIAGIVAVLALVSLQLSAHASTNARDAAIVKAGLLTVNDLPPGWAESPSSSSGDTNLSGYGKACNALQRKEDAAKKLRTAYGRSPDFKQGSADQISNTVSVYRSTASTKVALAVMTNPALPSCFQKSFQDGISQQATNGATFTTAMGRLSVPKLGDDTVGYEIAITANVNGSTFHHYIDLELVQVGRTGLSFSFQGDRRSTVLANQSLVQTVVARVQAAEAATT